MLYVHARVTYLMCMCACMCIYVHAHAHVHVACAHVHVACGTCTCACTCIMLVCPFACLFVHTNKVCVYRTCYYYLLTTANMPLIWGPLLSFLM